MENNMKDINFNGNEIDNETLDSISGGNTGDYFKEHALGKPFYKKGDKVNVFTTTFHTDTRPGTITSVIDASGYWLYRVKFEDNTREIYPADAFQR